MSQLKIILIDVAWGDSIFLEATDSQGNEHYALIDSNDTTHYKSSLIFLRKYFQRKLGTSKIEKPMFDWVMLSHAHLDHGQGLKEIMRTLGTQNLYYPKSIANTSLAHLQQYANRVNISHQAIDNTRVFPNLGDAKVNILWPQQGNALLPDENNNSIVFTVTQADRTAVFTGDAEEEVWKSIGTQIPKDTVFFKVPHHGSRNGSLDHAGNPTWLQHCPPDTLLGMSTHNRPYNHPHQNVLNAFKNAGYKSIRTDENYHLEITLNASGVSAKYSR